MVKKVKTLIGKVYDGDSETAAEDHLSKKIYDAVASATAIHSVSISKWGKLGLAVVVYEG